MALVIICPSCKVMLTLGDDFAGTTLGCPKCGAAIRVPFTAPPLPPPHPMPPPLPSPSAGRSHAPTPARIKRRAGRWVASGFLVILCVTAVIAVRVSHSSLTPTETPPEQKIATEVHDYSEVGGAIRTAFVVVLIAVGFIGAVLVVSRVKGCPWWEGVAYVVLGVATLFLILLAVAGSGRRREKEQSSLVTCTRCGAAADRTRIHMFRCPVCGGHVF